MQPKDNLSMIAEFYGIRREDVIHLSHIMIPVFAVHPGIWVFEVIGVKSKVHITRH